MASSTKASTEPFVRVRLIHFNDGKSLKSLEHLRLKIDTVDSQQILSNRPKFPEYDTTLKGFSFETRAKQGRQIAINVYNCTTKINYVFKTSIDELIRQADGLMREYRFIENGRGKMSIDLIVPENIRAARRISTDKLRKHYGHEFISKYFMNLPAFCAECRKLLWGFGSRGYRCQLCDLVVHEQCIDRVTNCRHSSSSDFLPQITVPHKFSREPNFLPVFCDHDGKIIPPLRAWKCSDCGIVVHSRCISKVPHFCGTRKIAVEMYEEWKEQNTPADTDTYLSTYECITEDMAENYQRILINIYQGLETNQNRDILHHITKTLENAQESSESSYYNRSSVFLHGLTFCEKLGQGMSGSVYWVKYASKDYALKALRKHQIFENNEYDCAKNERDMLILCRNYPFIIQLYAVVHDFQRLYFLLEHAPCGNFYEFLAKLEFGLDFQCVQWFSGQIICALRFLQSKLIIHRDLKPENVLVLPDGHIKLADFGFSKQFTSSQETTRTYCGTPEYIAPEIYQHMNYSFPVDCWSLGIMIYEMLMLNTPFYRHSDHEVKEHVLGDEFHPPTHVPIDLQIILRRLLKKHPHERFTIHDLQSSRFYSSPPYSLEQIEHRSLPCPWKQPIPLHFSMEIHSPSSMIHLSYINEQALCTTLTTMSEHLKRNKNP